MTTELVVERVTALRNPSILKHSVIKKMIYKKSQNKHVKHARKEFMTLRNSCIDSSLNNVEVAYCYIQTRI